MKNLIIIIVLFLPFVVNGQNLVPNSSFEMGFPGYPNNISQLPLAIPWKNFGSSDWYSNAGSLFLGYYDITGATSGAYDTNPLAPPPLPIQTPHTGNKFIGFGPCEGAQVKLTSKIEKDEYVTVSFWWSPRTKNDTEINIYLLEDAAPINALSNCYSPNISYEFTSKVVVNSSGSDAVHIPGEWYFYTSETFLLKKDIEYEWIAIKGSNVPGSWPDPQYIYVDDITVTSTPECSHICSNKLGPVGFQQIMNQPNVLANAMIGNSGQNWFMLVENATKIDFEVFSNASGKFFEYHAYDPNGLKDPGFPDYAFEWNGENDNGNAVPQGIYSFNINIENCTSQIQHIAQPLFIIPANNGNPIPNPPTQNNIIENCCKPFAIFNNIVSPPIFREDVDDFIIVGAGAPTIIPPTASVKLYAGNSIKFGVGFLALGNLEAKIVPCGTFGYKSSLRDRELISQSQMDSLFKEELTQVKNNNGGLVFLYPNPNNGQFNVELENNDGDALIEVYDLMGKKVFSEHNTTGQLVVNIEDQPKGIYLVKITIDDEVFNEKIVYQ